MNHAFPAPAKLNLFLHVIGRRPDGYHLLQSVFRLISHGDTVHLELRDDGRIVREGDFPGVPEDADLTVRAARLLQAHAAAGAGVSIRLEKNLPLAAAWAAAVRMPPRSCWRSIACGRLACREKPSRIWLCNWAPTCRYSCSARRHLPKASAKSCIR